VADFLATNEFAGTGAVMQVEINFAGVRLDLPDQPNPYLEDDDVKGVIITPATPTTVEVQVPVTMVKINDNTFTTAPTTVGLGNVLRVYRDTDIEFPIVDFVSLQVVSESDLDSQARQTLYAVMESRDNAAIAVDRATDAGAVAVAANITANEALDKAEQAIVTADAADAKADEAIVTANAADLKSDQALLAAASAEEHADNVEILAAQAAQDAADAAASAATANANADEALTTANAIAGTAQAAFDAATASGVVAQDALDVANGIASTAQDAFDVATDAQTAANQAVLTANGIADTAQDAFDAAALAQTAANNAVTTANAAADDASDALALALAAQPADATLTALASTVLAADRIIYGTGTETAALTTLTATGRDVIASTSKADLKNKLVISGRNAIINGNFQITQRGLSVPVPSGSLLYGGPDRFYAINANAGGQFTQAVNSITENGAVFPAIVQQVNNILSDLAGAKYWGGIHQTIEGYDARRFVGKTATLSFLFYASIAGNYSVSLRGGLAANSYVTSFVYTTPLTPQRVTINIAAFPSNIDIPADNTPGINLMIGAQNNGNFIAPSSNVWLAGNYIAAVGLVQWGSTANAYIACSQLQLEVGDSKSEFEFEAVSVTLTKCLRFYEQVVGTVNPAQGIYVHRPYKVSKRTTPSLTVISGGLGGGNIDAGGGSASFRAPANSGPGSDQDFTVAANAEF
jgi:hypothetical protein